MNDKFLHCLLFICLFGSVKINAQQQNNDLSADSLKTNQLLLNHEKNILETAQRYQDYTVTTSALYRLMAIDSKNTIWKDSLCTIYFRTGAYRQCLTIASELISIRPADQRLMAIIAFSEKNLGMVKEALVLYEKLYPLTGDLYDLYEIAGIQFSLKRLGECEQSVNKLINALTSEQITISLSYDLDQKQMVPVKAAALNLKGVIMQEYGKKQEAIHYFEDALKIYPEFTLAKKNLQLLQASNKK